MTHDDICDQLEEVRTITFTLKKEIKLEHYKGDRGFDFKIDDVDEFALLNYIMSDEMGDKNNEWLKEHFQVDNTTEWKIRILNEKEKLEESK